MEHWGTPEKMGLIFPIQNSNLLNWPLPTGEIFQAHGQNRPVVNFQLSIFVIDIHNTLIATLSIFLSVVADSLTNKDIKWVTTISDVYCS